MIILNNLIRAEFLKIYFTRSLHLLLVLAIIASPLLTLLISITGGIQETSSVAEATVSGTLAGLILLWIWGSFISTSEYSHGMIISVLTACPRRISLAAAKLLIVFVIAFLVSFLSLLLTFIVVINTMATIDSTGNVWQVW